MKPNNDEVDLKNDQYGHQLSHREDFLGRSSFSVTPRVALQLGRESISSSIVAISELVKNSFDADAEKVVIKFRGLDTEYPTLIINDDGNGMSQQQLEANWMVIGTPNKLALGRSTTKARALTGEKGLGRLGLDRLSTQTVVRTITLNEGSGVELVIDWTKYETLTVQRLESIEHDLYRIAKILEDPLSQTSREIDHGTQLVLIGLKDTWSLESIKRLRQELALLVSPFNELGDFSIEIDSGMNWEPVDGQVHSNMLLNAAEWKLEATIGEDDAVSFKMHSTQSAVNFVEGPHAWSEAFKNVESTYPRCGSLSFVMYFFRRQAAELSGLSFTRAQITEFLNANNGIRVYRDGFRVKPYGSPDGTGDWLRLSYRRVQNPQAVTQKPIGSWRVGYNQIIGAVFISRFENANLVDQTNRENLVEGPAFSDLKMFALKAIEFFETKLQTFEIERSTAIIADRALVKYEADEAKEATNRVLEQAKNILGGYRQATVPSEAEAALIVELDTTLEELETDLRQNQEAQEAYEKVLLAENLSLRQQKDTLANLASIGILASYFGHETLGAANLVANNARDLQSDLTRGLFMVNPDVRADVEDELRAIVNGANKIQTFSEFTIRNVSRDLRKRQAIRLTEIVSRVLETFATVFDGRNINIIIDVPDSISPILAFEIDWESILVNMLTNSVWALENVPAEDRVVRVKITESEKAIHLFFADSGAGIESGTEERIFYPTFSTKRNENGEVWGTGMGLSIVRDFVESHRGGSIVVISPSDLGGAEFHLSVEVPDLISRGRNAADDTK